jgi:hypothetical protein
MVFREHTVNVAAALSNAQFLRIRAAAGLNPEAIGCFAGNDAAPDDIHCFGAAMPLQNLVELIPVTVQPDSSLLIEDRRKIIPRIETISAIVSGHNNLR